ncbi:Dolichyl-phosphate-mannose-protein mannosyltransferase [Gigaspora margarita]|uniref:Dolichyl-phosphate-mannose-protein mannosyltransferase n=1 Tax=Gigaspora margarita TaxID=4874 RepID=A0A8H4AW88_GIGMA|nr:Dolichyl-phosphate-mannose-protein mannosyltransferase [Gigaspora margarita]
MADEIFNQNTSRRGRGRPRGSRGTATRSRATTTLRRTGSISEQVSPQTSRQPSPTPSIASVSSGIRRLGSLQPDLPPPGRLASVRTVPTGHYFLPTSSRVTLRGTQRMTFVPSVPEAHRRPQPTLASDSISPDFFDNDDSSGNYDLYQMSHGYNSMQRGGIRGRSRYAPDLIASGPFAYGSNSTLTSLGTNGVNIFNSSIIEERKNRAEFAADFETFRDDPWAPDMLTVEIEKEDNIAGYLEEKDRNRRRRTFFSFYHPLVDNENFMDKDCYDNQNSKEKSDQYIDFESIDDQLLCFQLPTILPKFEAPKKSSPAATKNSIPEKNQGKIDKNKLTAVVGNSRGKDIDSSMDNDKNEPEGQIGRLVIRKSGKMQLLLGNFIFDVNQGVDRSFLENGFVVDAEKSSVYNLGQIKHHLIVKPNIASLLGS